MTKELLFNLRKFLAPEIVYGEGALNLAGRHACNLGANRVLLVSDPGVEKYGWTSKVEESLREANLSSIKFTSITANPKDHEVMAGAKIYVEEACDMIIAVGGGSPMDCAKGIGVIATNSGFINNFEGIDEITNPAPPLIFIPTTAGTSADISQFAIITDSSREVKIAIISKMVIPDIALVDPSTTATMPPALTAATGMDVLCHAFEAFVSTASSPLTDMAALSSAKLVLENLIGAYKEPENMEYRGYMMMASLMAGLAFSNASLGLVHAMAHSLGGALGLAHGDCNALLLEEVVNYNFDAAPEKYTALALNMGFDVIAEDQSKNGPLIAKQIAKLRKQIGLTQCLADMGVTPEDLPRLADFAFNDPCLATNPKQPDPLEIQELYTKAF